MPIIISVSACVAIALCYVQSSLGKVRNSLCLGAHAQARYTVVCLCICVSVCPGADPGILKRGGS